MTDDLSVLHMHGFPDVHSFKRAYAGPLGDLTVDNVWSDRAKLAAAQLPLLSPHFNVELDHLRSAGNGQCLIRREIVHAGEALRASVGHPLSIVDGYRDPAHNAALEGSETNGIQHGAATHSQHVLGLALDISASSRVTVAQVKACHRFSGIGFSKSSGFVLHVDVRHVDPHTNYTHSTVDHPAMWEYK